MDWLRLALGVGLGNGALINVNGSMCDMRGWLL